MLNLGSIVERKRVTVKINPKTKTVIALGTMCAIAYLAVYINRNVLSAVAPQMYELGVADEKYVGMISSAYLVCYAVGQLINGIIGDKIKAKYMVSLGLLFAGISNLIFLLVHTSPAIATVVYASAGFFLAMIYAPMTKMISENTDPVHATRCSLGYTFSSYIGSPLAGILALSISWKSVFGVSIAALALMAIICFGFFTYFERKGAIKYGQYKIEKKSGDKGITVIKKSLKVLVKRDIIKFSIISIITGVVRTSVVFWLPTYIVQYLGFSPKVSASVFTVATLVISATAFISVFIYERLGRNMDKTVFIMFLCAAVFFTGTYFFKTPILNIIMLIIAIMGSNGAATMIWSRYCPSLYDTGMVSTVTGFLDFLSYTAAALANKIFADASTEIGWGNMILIWIGLMVVGIIIALPWKKKECNI